MTGTIKRMLATLVATGMLLFSLPALAGTGDKTIYHREDGGDAVLAAAYVDGTVYVFTWGSVYYTWTAESGKLTEYPFDDSQFQRADGGYTNINAIIPAADGAYAIVVASDSTEEGGTEVNEVTLCPIAFAEDGTATVGAGVSLEWEDMVCEEGEYEYLGEIRFPFISGNRFTFTTYPDGDEATFFVFDMETGACEEFVLGLAGDRATSMGYCACGDGMGLYAEQDDSMDDSQVRFYTLDLETGAFSQAGTATVAENAHLSNLAYDFGADAVYYVMDGRLYRMTGLDGATIEAVAAAPVDEWLEQSPILMDGAILLSDYATVMLRSTDPAARAENSITVFSQYNSAMERAYYTFTDKYPDTDVVITAEYPDITDAMLAQSDAIDVYVADIASEDFGVLNSRGYLADLSGSDALTAAVAEMYPDIRDAVTRDGRLVALPVDIYVSDLISYNPAAFEKLGLTEADVPATWGEFFALLQRLPSLIGDTGVVACDPCTTQADFRRELFYELVQAYMLYLEKTPSAETAFDTELLRGLLAEFEKIDFSGLGLPADWDDVDEDVDDDSILFEFYSYLCVDQVGSDNMTPFVLAMEEGGAPMMQIDLTVAFANPYSKNVERAIQYLEEAAANLDDAFLTGVCPDRNDPIPNAGYDEAVADYQAQIAAIRAELEKADGDDAADWQAQLELWQTNLELYMESGAWDASAESIKAYRAYARYLKVYTYFGLSDDDTGAIFDPASQYLDGAVDADTMLKDIDRKLEMMLLEGA